MSTRSAHILEEALALPPQERAELVDQILASFGTAPDQAMLKKWGEEAESRLDAIERGDLPTIPADQVFAKYRTRKRD